MSSATAARHDTADDLPDERGCVRLVEGFWGQMRADLATLPSAVLAANAGGEELERLERRYPMKRRTPEQAKEISRAGNRWEGYERDARECLETARWVLDIEAKDIGSLRFWCDLAGADAATVSRTLRDEFPCAFAALATTLH